MRAESGKMGEKVDWEDFMRLIVKCSRVRNHKFMDCAWMPSQWFRHFSNFALQLLAQKRAE